MAFIPLYYVSSSLDAWSGKYPYKVKKTILTANTDNYDLEVDTALDRNQTFPRVFEISSSAAFNLTGVVAPATARQGVPYFLVNTGAFTITLINAATSTAANQFNVTLSGNYSLTAGSYVMIMYETVSAKWTVGLPVSQNAFTMELPASATEGVLIAYDNAFWSAHNTGFYDAAGTKTANAVDVFYRYGNVAPVLLYASSTAAERESIPLEPGRDEIIQVPRSYPIIYWLSTNTVGGPTIRFRKNEQGYGLNKQQ